VIEHARTIPVWAVGGEVGSSSKVVLAIDGSESALRAVDHIGLMIGDNSNVKVTLLHVTPRLRDYCTIEFDEEGKVVEDLITQGDRQCVESFYLHAQQRFKEAGIKEGQLDIREVKSMVNVGRTIVDEVEKGGYGTLVLGSRGVSESFFLGGVSRYCFNKTSNCAVWIVP
jgi:nucleotide-binding universal stress UspA family protein